jgi:hypothetical protein
MIWGGIFITARQNSKQYGVTASYCAEIVIPVIVPYIVNCNADVLQHYKARCHTAGHTWNVFDAKYINTLEWPSKFKNLSLIEHMWNCLGITSESSIKMFWNLHCTRNGPKHLYTSSKYAYTA